MNANNLVTRLGRRLLGKEDGLDVGEHAAPRDGDVLQQSVEVGVAQAACGSDGDGLQNTPADNVGTANNRNTNYNSNSSTNNNCKEKPKASWALAAQEKTNNDHNPNNNDNK